MRSPLWGLIVGLFVIWKLSLLSLCGQEHNECAEKTWECLSIIQTHILKAQIYSLGFYRLFSSACRGYYVGCLTLR